MKQQSRRRGLLRISRDVLNNRKGNETRVLLQVRNILKGIMWIYPKFCKVRFCDLSLRIYDRVVQTLKRGQQKELCSPEET